MARRTPIRDRLESRIQQLQRDGLRRTLAPLEMVGPTTARWQGRSVSVFCSNDYLGLAQHPEMKAAWQGGGSGSARLISGDRPVHHALEEALGDLYGRPATLLSSGYHANLAVLTTLLEKGDVVASDALNHASIIDGVRLSGAQKRILPHGSASLSGPVDLAVVEGLYSMNGDVLDLATYQGDHALMVDEAHSVGAMGPNGTGVAAAQGVEPDVLIGTLGKAYGAYGAFVVGPASLRELLLSRGRSFIFTTGLPEPVAAAARQGLRLATNARRERLRANVDRLRAGLVELGINAEGTDHIVPVVLGAQAMPTAEALRDAGFYVTGIRPPTVAPGHERIRLTLSAEHTVDQIDGLLGALESRLC